MNLTGKIVGIATNFLTKKFELTISVNEPDSLTKGYEELQDVELLDIRIEKHRKKRSLDANAYFHVLVCKLADKLRISKARCKNMMICRYGQPLFADSEGEEVRMVTLTTNIPVSQMWEIEVAHCMPYETLIDESGEELIRYRVYRGSHTYDTREMSILIDGIVSECKEQGIETMPPDELERMLQRWKA